VVWLEGRGTAILLVEQEDALRLATPSAPDWGRERASGRIAMKGRIEFGNLMATIMGS
jgi:hypothetical protein